MNKQYVLNELNGYSQSMIMCTGKSRECIKNHKTEEAIFWRDQASLYLRDFKTFKHAIRAMGYRIITDDTGYCLDIIEKEKANMEILNKKDNTLCKRYGWDQCRRMKDQTVCIAELAFDTDYEYDTIAEAINELIRDGDTPDEAFEQVAAIALEQDL